MGTRKADLVIRNALLIDGTGAAGTPGDLAVSGERITAIGLSLACNAVEEVDAVGKALAPGFIDAPYP